MLLRQVVRRSSLLIRSGHHHHHHYRQQGRFSSSTYRNSLDATSEFEHLERYYRFDDLNNREAHPMDTNNALKFSHLEPYYKFEDPKEVDLVAIQKHNSELAELIDCDVAWLDTVFCNNQIKRLCLISRNSPTSLEHAERVLDIMEELRLEIKNTDYLRHHPPLAVPDAYSYIHLMKAFLRTGKVDRARSILRRMETASQSNDTDMTAAHDVFRRTFIFLPCDDSDDPRARYDSFLRLKRPDVKSFNAVLRSYVVARRADEAFAILREVCRRNVDDERFGNCAPDLVSFNTVANGLAEAGEGDAVESLSDMLEESEGNGGGFGPDVYTRAAVVVARCNEGDVTKADAALQRLENDLRTNRTERKGLDLSLHTRVVREWGRRVRGTEGADGARRAIDRMVRASEVPGLAFLRPNTIVCNALLSVFADRRMANRCRNVIKDMKARWRDTGDAFLKPDVVSYRLWIKATAVDGSLATHQRISRIIETVERDFDRGVDDVEPDASLYRILLRKGSYALRRGGPEFERILRRAGARGHLDALVRAAATGADRRRSPEFETSR